MKEPSVHSDWYRFQRDQQRRYRLLYDRARLVRAIRAFFDRQAFLEIEAPILVPCPGLELHLDAYKVEAADHYLITSPEYQLKRLLSAGFEKIFSLGKVFRRGESGPHHNPEFTMLEWYRAHQGWKQIAEDVQLLCAQIAQVQHGSPLFSYQGKRVDLRTPWEWMSVEEACKRHAGCPIRGDEPVAQLVRWAQERSCPLPTDVSHWDDVFFSIFMHLVEPHLGAPPTATEPYRPVVLYDWPRPLCALAQVHPEKPWVVERFEAYVAGLELCNGFGELCDPVEQYARFQRDVQERQHRGLPAYPIDERFLAALDHGMPPSAGVALGVDRLMMLVLDVSTIEDIVPFPIATL